jgi:hypothetical protein
LRLTGLNDGLALTVAATRERQHPYSARIPNAFGNPTRGNKTEAIAKRGLGTIVYRDPGR